MKDEEGRIEVDGHQVAQLLDVALGVGVQVARDDVVDREDQRLTAGVVEIEAAVSERFDAGDARQASTPPDMRIEVIAKPRGLQGFRGVDPQAPASSPMLPDELELPIQIALRDQLFDRSRAHGRQALVSLRCSRRPRRRA